MEYVKACCTYRPALIFPFNGAIFYLIFLESHELFQVSFCRDNFRTKSPSISVALQSVIAKMKKVKYFYGIKLAGIQFGDLNLAIKFGGCSIFPNRENFRIIDDYTRYCTILYCIQLFCNLVHLDKIRLNFLPAIRNIYQTMKLSTFC